jgi:hypothetical protein
MTCCGVIEWCVVCLVLYDGLVVLCDAHPRATICYDTMISRKDTQRLNSLDDALITALFQKAPVARKRSVWRNRVLQRRFSASKRGLGPFREFETFLSKKGLFDIRIERHHWTDCDGRRYRHTLARAAVTDMWPMGTHYWLRDSAIIGARLLQSSQERSRAIGREILISGMNFISSVSQLARFEAIIRSTSARYRSDSNNWPFIFAGIKGNLSTAHPEPWAHKQDAWQILAWHVLSAIEAGQISTRDLTEKHRLFLGRIVPFLAKVSFWSCENSGSWEEIPSVRTSVRAWEHRLIVRLGELSKRREFSFLAQQYTRKRKFLGRQLARMSFAGAVDFLDTKATEVMVGDLPFEAPGYSKRDPRYRTEDGALIYLLELDYVWFLAQRAGKSKRWARQMEERILSGVLSLQDSWSGGIYRYANDSYQRSGFFRYLTVAKLNELYGAPSGESSTHFTERGRIVPTGRRAAWTHFVAQLSAWAGTRFLETGEASYRKLHERFFAQSLALVTAQHERSLEVDSKGQSKIISIPAWKMPECYIADRDQQGRELVFPSPHTPLNWATAELINAFTVHRRTIQHTSRVAGRTR